MLLNTILLLTLLKPENSELLQLIWIIFQSVSKFHEVYIENSEIVLVFIFTRYCSHIHIWIYQICVQITYLTKLVKSNISFTNSKLNQISTHALANKLKSNHQVSKSTSKYLFSDLQIMFKSMLLLIVVSTFFHCSRYFLFLMHTRPNCYLQKGSLVKLQ